MHHEFKRIRALRAVTLLTPVRTPAHFTAQQHLRTDAARATRLARVARSGAIGKIYLAVSCTIRHTCSRTMTRPILNLVLRLVISLLIFAAVMFFVAWLLEDIIFFSLFIGIPAGLISAILAFALLTVRHARQKK